jgi:hypothetical protein
MAANYVIFQKSVETARSGGRRQPRAIHSGVTPPQFKQSLFLWSAVA